MACGTTTTGDENANNNAHLIGANSQTYQSGFESLAAGTNFDSGEFTVSPGATTVGWVSFDVPDGVAVHSIQWSDGFGSQTATWTA